MATNVEAPDGRTPYRIGFLLVPDFSMIAFASAVEALRLANFAMDRPAYDWTTLGTKEGSVLASNTIEVNVEGTLKDAGPLEAIFVCGGVNIEDYENKVMLAGLRRRVAHGVALGALCTGSHMLARAGLLDGYRSTIHWENIPAFVEAFPDLDVVSDLFVVDRNRYTCAGGTSALDLMLDLISRQYGTEIAAAVSDKLIHHRIRDSNEAQRMDLRSRSGISHPKLLAIVTAMENNIELPMTCAELAFSVGLSTRQLERLFRSYIGATPTRYYLRMRLERARFLLRHTSLSIFDVALATGFISASHFSKCFREQFNSPPSADRRRENMPVATLLYERDADTAGLT